MPAVNTYITSTHVAPHLWARQCELSLLVPAGKGVTGDNEQKRMISSGNWKKREADDIYYVILARCFSIGAPSRLTWIYFLYWIYVLSHFSHIYLCVVCLLSFYIGKNARLTLPSIIADQPLAFIIHTKYSITAWNFRFNLPSVSALWQVYSRTAL